MQTYHHYIDGKWIPSSSGGTFESFDPATEKPIGQFQQGTEKDVHKAVEAAQKAFPAWSDIPAPKRGEILFEIVHLLKKNKERLARIVTTEMGKVLKEGLGDVQEAKPSSAGAADAKKQEKHAGHKGHGGGCCH